MKKMYIIPTAKAFSISTESLMATSLTVDNSDDNAITGEGGDDAWTQRQQGGNSLWDTWSE